MKEKIISNLGITILLWLLVHRLLLHLWLLAVNILLRSLHHGLLSVGIRLLHHGLGVSRLNRLLLRIVAAFLSRRAWCTVWAVGVLNSSAVRDGSLRLSIIIGSHVPSLSFHSSSLLLFSGDNDSNE